MAAFGPPKLTMKKNRSFPNHTNFGSSHQKADRTHGSLEHGTGTGVQVTSKDTTSAGSARAGVPVMLHPDQPSTDLGCKELSSEGIVEFGRYLKTGGVFQENPWEARWVKKQSSSRGGPSGSGL